MESMARWFCEELRPSVVNFEPLTESDESRTAGLFPPNPHDFARHALRAWRVLRFYGCKPACATVLTNGIQNSSCPVGKDAIIVHPDGLIASCYLVPDDWKRRNMDLTIGQVRNDGTVDIRMPDVLRLRRLIYSKPRCEKCFCRLTCAGGCHVNNSYPGCPDGYSDMCIYTRTLTACSLLEDLGLADVADELVTDPDGLEQLRRPVSDRVVDFHEGL